METFSIDKITDVLVKPLKPTPSEILSFSSIDNAFVVDSLIQSVYVYKANHNLSVADEGQEHPASVIIKDALSKVLVYYYPLAGKLRRESHDGKLQLKCNANGVPLVLAKANCKLSSVNYLDNIDVNFTRKCVSDFPSEPDGSYRPLVLQLTIFSCGGFTIGMTLNHTVCDGFGAGQFFRALTELASGKTEPTVKPVWGRERLVVDPTDEPLQFPVDINSLATSPYLPTDLAHECFDVSDQSIKRLKMNLMKETDVCSNESFTTFEVLGAYVWISRIRAMKMDLDGKVCFALTVGIRGLLDPPLPEGYYGNAVISAGVVMSGKDVVEGSLSSVVKLITQTKKLASSKDYIATSLGNLENISRLNVDIRGFMGTAFMGSTDWRHIGLLEGVDFGWECVNSTTVPEDMPWVMNWCLFMPPPKLHEAMKGGVRVSVILPGAAMVKFKEEMHALIYGHVDAIAT